MTKEEFVKDILEEAVNHVNSDVENETLQYTESLVEEMLLDYEFKEGSEDEEPTIELERNYQDRITEMADTSVSIYNNDLYNWLDGSTAEWVERSIEEFGVDTRNISVIKLIQQGQFLMYETALYDIINYLIDTGYVEE